MNWYRKYPLFALGLTVCGAVAVGEGALIVERYFATVESARRLEQRKTDLAAMEQLAPPPTREVAAAIEADLAKAQKALAAMRGELTGRGPAAERIRTAKVPAARTDSYFDLATFVEKTKELADKNGVEVRPEAVRFGYARYANEGPEADRIEPVFRQRQIAEYLLGSLLEARPRALLSIKREHMPSKAEREARAAAQAAGQTVEEVTSDPGSDSPDYFVIDPRVSARVPGYVDTTAFRLVFTGQTAALRTFLNHLASFELPVLVREVEVEPATLEEAASAKETEISPAPAAAAADTPVAPSVVLKVAPPAAKEAAPPRAARPNTATPIVSKSLSKYTVTVEYVELVTGQAAPADPPAATSNQ